MWILLLECFRGGGTVDSGDTGDSGFEPEPGVTDFCGDFWGTDDLGKHWEYTFVPDEWITGWNDYDVVRTDEHNGRVVWVQWNEGKRDTGSARHRWRKERWFACDEEGIWLVHGTTTWTTWRQLDREDYAYVDVMSEPGFLYPAVIEEGMSWESTGTIQHVDAETGTLISETSLAGVHEVVGMESIRVPHATYDALVLESGPEGSQAVTTSWLVPGIGVIADDTWLLSRYNE